MKILIAEDEPGNLEEIERILTDCDEHHDFTGCLNPFDALSAAAGGYYHAAVLDIQMPGMNGLELAEKLSVIAPDLPVIFLTAYNHYAAEAFDLKVADYVLKPVREDRLLKALRKIQVVERRVQTDAVKSSTMTIHSFGGLEVLADNGAVQWDRNKTAELFSYLLFNKGVRIHKDELCEELWGNLDEHRALANLQVTMSRLRKILGVFDRKMVCISFSNHTYMMTIDKVKFDYDEFADLSGAADSESLLKALALYRGDILESEGWLWAQTYRERMKKLHIHIIKELATIHYKDTDVNKAEAILRDHVSKYEPDDSLCILFLEAAYRTGGKSGIASAYKLLQKRYKNVYAIDVPAPVTREHSRLLGGNGPISSRFTI